MKEKKFVGIDILETYFPKYVVLDKSEIGLSLVECGEILDIRKKILEVKGLAEQVVVSIPRDKVIMRNFEIDSEDDSQIDSLVIEELKNSLPLDIEEIDYRYKVVQKKNGKSSILFAAVTKVQLQYYMSMLGRLGFDEVVINISSIAYYNCFLFNYKDVLLNNVYYLLHIGTRTVEICIVADGAIVFTKSLNLGADAVAHYLEEFLEIDFEKAQKITYSLKENGDSLPDEDKDQVVKGLKSWNEKLIKEIDLSVKFFKAKHGGRDLTEILISGCGVPLESAKDLITSKIGVPVSDLDPFKSVHVENKEKVILGNLCESALFLPMGLGVQSASKGDIDFDFYLKEDVSVAKKDEEVDRDNISVKFLNQIKQNKFVQAGVGIFILLVCFSLFFRAGYVGKVKKFNALKDEYVSLEESIADANKKKVQLSKFKPFLKKYNSVLGYIKFVVMSLNNKVVFTTLDYYKGDMLVIEGQAVNTAGIKMFVSKLKKSDYFLDVISEKVAEKKGKEKWLDFKLICSIKNS